MAIEKLKIPTSVAGRIELKPLEAAKFIGTAVFAGLLGASPGVFACYPLGIALLAAVERRIAATFLGLVISSLFSKGSAIILAITYTLAFVARVWIALLRNEPRPSSIDSLLTLKPHFDEPMIVRLALSAGCAFFFGLWRLIGGGFLYYDLFGLLVAFFICPALTLMMAAAFLTPSDDSVKLGVTLPELLRRGELSDALRLSDFSRLGRLTLMLSLLVSLGGMRIFGFSPAYMVALLTAMVSSLDGGVNGAMRGCAIGLICGIACGEPGAAVTVAASGLCAGALMKLSKPLATAGVCMVSLALGITENGFDTLNTILPDTLGAVTVFLPLQALGLLKSPSALLPNRTSEPSVLSESTVAVHRQEDTAARMSSLSTSLGKLSELIYNLSDRLRRPGILDLKQICDNAFDSNCNDCRLADTCLERECSSNLDARSKLTTELYTSGRVSPEQAPEWLRERCPRLESIVDELNESTAALVSELLRSDKLEVFALDYEMLSRLLAESVAENEAEYRLDPDLTRKLDRALHYMNLNCSHAVCWGSRRLQVVISGARLPGLRIGADELRRSIENTVGVPLTPPSFRLDGELAEVTLTSRRLYSIESAKATSVKESESANGDTSLIFEGRGDRLFALISDGMGSGREAAITSKLCAVFAEQLLGAGNGKAVTLEMLSSFLRKRRSECSATIDLTEIDLLNGDACFVKSGAAPSFVLRGGNIYKLESHTLPIGIVEKLDAEQIRFKLEAGDVIVMLSDGIAQSLEDGVWLMNLLTYDWCNDLELMAEKIVDSAAVCSDRSDDMTVVLLRVDALNE